MEAVYSVCRFGTGTKHDVAIKAGVVCRLKRDAASDGIHDENGWHNPPLVLVLPDETGVDGMVRVAQIHDASELAGPGDFPLTGKYADCFAESWNTWPAFTDTLEYRGTVSEDIAASVSSRARSPMPQINEETVEFWFRRQELNIGGFFGRIAAARGLALHEAQSQTETTHSAKVSFLSEWKKNHLSDFIHNWRSQPLAAAASGADGTRPSHAFLLRGNDLKEGKWVNADVSETCFGDTVMADVTVHLPAEFASLEDVTALAFTDSCEEWSVLSAEIEDEKAFISLQLEQPVWDKTGRQVPRLVLHFDNRRTGI